MAALSTAWSTVNAQSVPTVEGPHHADLSLSYDYLRSNAPPDGCGCFSLNGGNAALALHLRRSSFAVVADLGVAHSGSAASIDTTRYSLTLSTFTAGLRYQPRFRGGSLQPFVEVLAGLVHSSGTLVEGQDNVASNAGAAFAGLAGGGLDLRINRRLSLRLIEANYLATKIDNGVNDHQNNLRLNTGIVFHF